jgi:3-hydroxyisobutyrate dehydrogenase
MVQVPRVGFVGLGDIGAPMARRIRAAGFPTTLWARRPSTLDAFPELDFARAATPIEVGACSDVFGICVFDDNGLREVLLGPGGVLAGMAAGGVVLIHSTASVTVCAEIAEVAVTRGVAVLDAPVSGARAGAEAGTLTVMVGGDRAAYERALPVLRSVGSAVHLLGPLGSGQAMKVLNNVLYFATGRLAAVAIETGAALGMDVTAVTDVLRTASARSFSLDCMADQMRSDQQVTERSAAVIRKDTALFRALREEAGVERTPLDELAADRVRHPLPRV